MIERGRSVDRARKTGFPDGDLGTTTPFKSTGKRIYGTSNTDLNGAKVVNVGSEPRHPRSIPEFESSRSVRHFVRSACIRLTLYPTETYWQ
jgi:hypothetical protein